MFKDLNNFEKWYLSIGFIVNMLIAYISKSDILAIICSLCSLLNAVYAAKGRLSSYIFGFIATLVYIYISFKNHYYSETFVNICIFIITVYGFINWLNNQDKKNNTVIINRLSNREIILSILSQVVLFFVYYRIFDYFDNEMILVSTINMCLTILAFYYNARMSKLSFIVMILSCIFKSILWIVPMMNGDFSNTPIVVSCILYLICDIYGYYNWSKIEKLQQ